MTEHEDHDHDEHAHDHDHSHEHHEHDHHEHVPVEYTDAVEGFRLDKDEFFKTRARSPIPEAEREAFTGLPYYPVDEALRFEEPRSSRTPARSRRTSRSRPRTASSGPPIGPGRSRFELGRARDIS